MVMTRKIVRLALAAGVLLVGCFEDVDEPAGDGTGETTGETGGDPSTGSTGPSSTTVEPGSESGAVDTGTDDGAESCAAAEVCVDVAPAGWQGPVAYFEGDDLAMLPSCAAPFGGLSTEVFDALQAGSATCEACGCGDAADVQCSSPTVRFYNSSSCAEFGDPPASEFALGEQDECTVFPMGSGAYGAESDSVTPVPGTGTCASSGGEASLDAPTWGAQLRACAPPELVAACGTDRVCAPRPGAPFAESLCIHRPGDVACPAGDYTERFLRYNSYEDTRGCSACSCGSPSGGACNAELLFSYTSTCEDDYLHLINPGSGGCTTLWGSTPSSGLLLVNEVTGASCVPSGGEAEGEATPQEPVTLCCTP